MSRPPTALLTMLPIAMALMIATSQSPHASLLARKDRPEDGQRAPLNDPLHPDYGWSWLDLTSTFGVGTTLAGLDATPRGLIVNVQESGGYANQDVYASSLYDARTQRLGPAHPAKEPRAYAGPVRLDWLGADSTSGLQQVQITQPGKSAIRWPRAVPVYGEFSQTEPYGAVDNQILGQSGDWLWVAMKGPAHAPFSLRTSPVFRDWDCILAIDLKTGAYRLLQLPPISSPVATMYTAPAFAVRGGSVWIGVSDWLGVLPADPALLPGTAGLPGTPGGGSGTSEGSDAATGADIATATADRALLLPVLRPVPTSVMQSRLTLAQMEFSALLREQAGSIASLWDNYIMGHRVPGVTGAEETWMSDGAYINQGYIPAGILFGSEFPVKSGSAAATAQARLIADLTQLGRNPLPSSIYTLTSAAQERKHFHAHPPGALLGYREEHDLYVPDPSTWPLPKDYPTYGDAFAAIGPLLAQSSPFPVWIPAPSSDVEVSPYFANVQYSVTRLGYDLNVYAGPRLAANSPAIVEGEANTDFSLHVQSASQRLSPDYEWDMNVAIPGARLTRVPIGHGIVATVYTSAAKGNQPAQESVTWRQEGWTWGMEGTLPSDHPLMAAADEASMLQGLRLPMPAGQCVFSFGSDAPSQIEFTFMGARYVLYTTGWRAPQIAASMVDLSAY
ncbi:MAG: hypothetical protein OWU32_06295 [Firmicutes bacterium]|nr:hypothetical protein [Bacillota bacterium]